MDLCHRMFRSRISTHFKLKALLKIDLDKLGIFFLGNVESALFLELIRLILHQFHIFHVFWKFWDLM